MASNNASVPVASTTIGPVSALTKSRFPRMQECAHFHYEVNTVDIPHNFQVGMLGNEAESATSTTNSNSDNSANFKPSTHDSDSNSIWFQLLVTSHEKKWIIYRTYENFCYLDRFLHECIFDRKFSCLDELKPLGGGEGNSNKEAIDSLMTSSVTSISSNVSFLPPNSTLKRNKNKVDQNPELTKHLRKTLTAYLNRFCEIAFINPINCGPILNWFEVSFL
jgi:hypothetical protein